MFQYSFSDNKNEAKYSIEKTTLTVNKKHYDNKYNITVSDLIDFNALPSTVLTAISALPRLSSSVITTSSLS